MTGKIHHAAQAAANDRFLFTAVNMKEAQTIMARYPAGRQSPLMPLLALAQRQNGNYLSKAAMDYIAGLLDIPLVRVYEVASFYTMYNLEPVGRHVINVCTTTPCWLRGSDAIVEACERQLGIGIGHTTAGGKFTLREVECLGACVNAPMCQVINRDGEYFYEDLTPQSAAALIDTLARDGKPKSGPQSGRKSSEPAPDALNPAERK